MISTGLGFLDSYNQSRAAKTQGEVDNVLGGIQADQLLRKATLRMNQGVHAADEEKYKGRVAVSDAIAAMAAGGSVVDPVILARLKRRSNYNAMTAIFNARQDAIDLRLKSDLARIGAGWQETAGDFKSKDIMLGATSTALTNWPKFSSKPVLDQPPPPRPGDWKV